MKTIISEKQYRYLKNEGKRLLFEQNGKKRVFQSLQNAFTLGLKSIDPKVLTNFLNFKIVDLGDFSKHIDEFFNIWAGSIIPGKYSVEGMKNFMGKIDAKIINK